MFPGVTRLEPDDRPKDEFPILVVPPNRGASLGRPPFLPHRGETELTLSVDRTEWPQVPQSLKPRLMSGQTGTGDAHIDGSSELSLEDGKPSWLSLFQVLHYWRCKLQLSLALLLPGCCSPSL